MRFLTPAAFFTSALLTSGVATAEPTPAAPAVAAAPAAVPAPQAAPFAPVYPAPPSYQPGYTVPFMVYSPPAAGAPPYWAPMAPPIERRSRAMRTTGIVLLGAGGLFTVVGSVLLGAVIATPCFNPSPDPPATRAPGPAPAGSRERVHSSRQALNGCDTSPAVGLVFLGAGALTALVGLPLFVIGSKPARAPTTTGKLAPELRVGAANASLRWSF